MCRRLELHISTLLLGCLLPELEVAKAAVDKGASPFISTHAHSLAPRPTREHTEWSISGCGSRIYYTWYNRAAFSSIEASKVELTLDLCTITIWYYEFLYLSTTGWLGWEILGGTKVSLVGEQGMELPACIDLGFLSCFCPYESPKSIKLFEVSCARFGQQKSRIDHFGLCP